MTTRIIPIELGFDTCYVLVAGGCIAVDAGQPNKVRRFLNGLARALVDPSSLSTVILTHAHWDHMGSARDIRAQTKAALWVHEAEAEWVRSGNPPLPPGVTPWGRTFMAMHRIVMPFIDVPPAEVDRELGSTPLRLDSLGIPGLLLHTPGHSPGSISIVLDSGEAFVGDLAMNRVPLCRAPALPIFAHSIAEVRGSWERLLEHPISTIYPAHGAPFEVGVIQRLLEEPADERRECSPVP